MLTLLFFAKISSTKKGIIDFKNNPTLIALIVT